MIDQGHAQQYGGHTQQQQPDQGDQCCRPAVTAIKGIPKLEMQGIKGYRENQRPQHDGGEGRKNPRTDPDHEQHQRQAQNHLHEVVGQLGF